FAVLSADVEALLFPVMSAAAALLVAASRICRIAAWALVAATAGLALQALRNRRNRPGSVVGSALGLSWRLLTYLIVPVLIFEERGIVGSLERSGSLFRKNWGEELAGSFGFGLLSFLMFLPGLGLGALFWTWDKGAAVIAVVVYTLILAAVTSAVKGIFTVALYRYATQGEAPAGFSADLIDGALGGRRPAGL
ncbi:MAG TPA: DUF6159 family protein, partial [Bryobacteraceae bacterium]|nr:DUF6159 family protein [Bryobacteraceae bacterium]